MSLLRWTGSGFFRMPHAKRLETEIERAIDAERTAPGDVNENTQMLISIKEWARLHEVEDAAKAAYPQGRWVVYFRPNAPRLKALRMALYRTD